MRVRDALAHPGDRSRDSAAVFDAHRSYAVARSGLNEAPAVERPEKGDGVTIGDADQMREGGVDASPVGGVPFHRTKI